VWFYYVVSLCCIAEVEHLRLENIFWNNLQTDQVRARRPSFVMSVHSQRSSSIQGEFEPLGDDSPYAVQRHTSASLWSWLCQPWRLTIISIIFVLLTIGSGSVGVYIGRNSVSSKATPIEAPLFPQEYYMFHNLSITGDVGRVWYSWPRRAWRAEHTNLFDFKFDCDVLFLNRTVYVYRYSADQMIPNLTPPSPCCRVQSWEGFVIFPPTWLRKPAHHYVGNSEVQGRMCRTFYNPLMASTFWDAPKDAKIVLESGMAFPDTEYVPIRWDNVPNVEQDVTGGLTTYYTDWIPNPGSAIINDTTYAVPSYCPESPPWCPFFKKKK